MPCVKRMKAQWKVLVFHVLFPLSEVLKQRNYSIFPVFEARGFERVWVKLLIFTHNFVIRMQFVIRVWLHADIEVEGRESQFPQIQGLGEKECLCDLQEGVLSKTNELLTLLWTSRMFSSEQAGKEKQAAQLAGQLAGAPTGNWRAQPPAPFNPRLDLCIHPLLLTWQPALVASQEHASVSIRSTRLFGRPQPKGSSVHVPIQGVALEERACRIERGSVQNKQHV